MRLENNFVQVENNPMVINKVNSVAAAFGWTVQSIQVTDSAVAYESGAVGWTTEYSTFVQTKVKVDRRTYASITYQRDRDDSRYAQWLSLEREYNATAIKCYLNDSDATRFRQLERDAELAAKKSSSCAGWGCGGSIVLLGVFFFVSALFFGISGSEWSGVAIVSLILIVGGLLGTNSAMKNVDEKVYREGAHTRLANNQEYVALKEKDTALRNVERQGILERASLI